MMRRLTLVLLLLAGCEQTITTSGPSSSDGRPSIVNACAEVPQKGWASAPQPAPRYAPPPAQPAPNVIVNVPRPDPTIRCDRGGPAATTE
jgi:hypothetical protein